jgi:LacI family transcriptional regulator
VEGEVSKNRGSETPGKTTPANSAARRVALAFPTRLGHLHSVVRGIMDYAQENGNWIFTTSGEAHDLSVRALHRWHGDGVITLLDTEAEARAARKLKLKVPVVTFVGTLRKPGIPRVMRDQRAIGRLAAEHLLARGFRNFGFYGVKEVGYSIDRGEAFAARLKENDVFLSQYLSPNMFDRRHPWDDEMDALCRWIKKMPVPVGIFAANDARGRMLADACKLVNRRVPEEVGIIGVDNSQLDCEFGSPKLSTIACEWHLVGYETAKLLDHLMRGEKAPEKDLLISPSGIVARESTDVMIADHPAVAKAIAYTRAHLGDRFGVKSLVAAAGVSRRYLETSFAQTLGKTPAQYLMGARVETAKTLMNRQSLTLSRVARECGFTDLRQFRRVFQRLEKSTPSEYLASRRASAGNAAAAHRLAE